MVQHGGTVGNRVRLKNLPSRSSVVLLLENAGLVLLTGTHSTFMSNFPTITARDEEAICQQYGRWSSQLYHYCFRGFDTS